MKPYTKWSAKEIEILRRCYPVGGAAYTEKVLRKIIQGWDRGPKAVKAKVVILKLSTAYDGRYRTGHFPVNKGKKMSKGLYKKCAPTMFKKGQKQHNEKYNGHISKRIDKRGIPYLFIRIEKGKYIPLHRKVYQDQKGIIPKGMVVIFIDGDTLNCKIENLKCITKRENLIRNQKCLGPPSLQLSDNAVAAYLKRTGTPPEAITPELIELKRAQYLLNRKIRSHE